MTRRTILLVATAVALAGAPLSVHVSPAQAASSHAWDTTFGGWNRSSSPTIADVNGDGVNDIVYGSQDGFVHVRNAAGAELPGWPQPAVVEGGATAIDSSPTVADLDNNGAKEIIVSVGSTWVVNQQGGLVVFNANGGVRWRFKSGDYGNQWGGTPGPDGYADGMVSTPAVGDIDGDGFPDIVVGGFDLQIHAFNRNGGNIAGFPFWHDDSVWSSPALFDSNGDGKMEIYVGGDSSPGGPVDWRGGIFRALEVQGNTVVERWEQRTGDVIMSSPAIGDIDGDGRKEAIVGGGTVWNHPDANKIFAWHLDDGSPVAGWPQVTGGSTIASPALGDIDGDGHPEVIAGSRDGSVYAWHGNGAPMWRSALVFRGASGGPIEAGPIVADVDGNGTQDVIVGNAAQLYGLDGHTGGQLAAFDEGWSYGASAAVGNFGAAGWRLIGAGFDTPHNIWHIYAVSLPNQSVAPAWPMFHHDAYHTGSIDLSPSLPLFSSNSVGIAATTAVGGVRVGGLTPWVGDLPSRALVPNQPVNGISRTSSGKGYWLVADDGGIFSFGDAPFYGSMGAFRLNQPMMGMAPTPGGRGYWMVARDGGIFSFGDAAFYGSTGNLRLNQPVVGMAPTPRGHGYWMVARDGGIFAFGDAGFYGSTGALGLSDIAGMASSPSGRGYRFVSTGGHVYCYGDAICAGDTWGRGFTIVGMQTSPSGNGYWLLTDTGVVVGFGDVAAAATRLPGSATPLVGVSPK
ncbi:MAG: VCBS repeat-containing protein [Acidimicrobiales bacterium]